MVVGEGDAQLASVHGHGGLSWGGQTGRAVEWRFSRCGHHSAPPTYLEFLPSDGLHVALLADGEVVGDLGLFGVDVGPAEGVARLGDLSDHLVVAALCDDIVGDACRGRVCAVIVAFLSSFFNQASRRFFFFFKCSPSKEQRHLSG